MDQQAAKLVQLPWPTTCCHLQRSEEFRGKMAYFLAKPDVVRYDLIIACRQEANIDFTRRTMSIIYSHDVKFDDILVKEILEIG